MQDPTNKITVYYDESGNSGQNLLDEEQRYFVLGSNCFSIDELAIFQSILPKGVHEFHFVEMKNSDVGRKAVLDLLNHELICEDKVIYAVADKIFVAAAKIVDLLIEPSFYDQGIDISCNGVNLMLTEYIMCLAVSSKNQERLYRLLDSFVNMIRYKTKSYVYEFYSIVGAWVVADKNEEYLMSIILASQNNIDNIIDALEYDKYALDVTSSLFCVLCQHWFKNTQKNVDAVFDNSKQMEYYKDFIGYMKNIPIPTCEVGKGDVSMVFPLPVSRLLLTDSATLIGVQISDIIASSIAFMCNNKNQKQVPFVNEIRRSKLANLCNMHTISRLALLALNQESQVSYQHNENPLDFLVTQMIKDN
jgi:hypothetical protein